MIEGNEFNATRIDEHETKENEKRNEAAQFWSSLTKEEKEALLSGALSFWTTDEYDDISCTDFDGSQMMDAKSGREFVVFNKLVKRLDNVMKAIDEFRSNRGKPEFQDEMDRINSEVERANQNYEDWKNERGE